MNIIYPHVNNIFKFNLDFPLSNWETNQFPVASPVFWDGGIVFAATFLWVPCPLVNLVISSDHWVTFY